MLFKSVAKNFADLKARLERRISELQDNKYYMSPQYAKMQEVVKKVQTSVERVQEWFSTGDFSLCDDELWRAGVDLDALKLMMSAVAR